MESLGVGLLFYGISQKDLIRHIVNTFYALFIFYKIMDSLDGGLQFYVIVQTGLMWHQFNCLCPLFIYYKTI